jgi:methionine biosynthesis protein MetW
MAPSIGTSSHTNRLGECAFTALPTDCRLAAILSRMPSLASLQHHLRTLVEPAPLEQFEDYDEYWDTRGDVPYMHRWGTAAGLIPSGSTVIDIGSGDCGFARHLQSKKPDVKITTSDLSPNAVAMARESGFDAVQLDLVNDEIHGHYDYVTCFEVIEHIPEAEVAMEKLMRAGDKVIISIPNVGYIGCRLRLALFGRFPTTHCQQHIKEHVRFWTPRDFAEWADHLGLRIVSMAGQYGLAPFWRRFPRLFASGMLYELERA